MEEQVCDFCGKEAFGECDECGKFYCKNCKATDIKDWYCCKQCEKEIKEEGE